MNFLQYWALIEFGIVVTIVSLLFLILWRKAKENKEKARRPLPETFSGKAAYFLIYVSKIIGMGLGVLLFLTLVIMFERSIILVYRETKPAPSEVQIPADLEFKVEEVTFKSEDGLKMAGWYVPAQNDATIILLHGYGGNRTAIIWRARQLVNAGYGVLMYDERASGESEGTYRSYGWEDPLDVKGAIQYLSSRNLNDNIGIAGCSAGADIALYSAALYPELGAVWADGASSVRAQDMGRPRNLFSALIIAGNYVLDWMYTVKLDIELPEPLTNRLGDIAPRPVMLVGGGTARPHIGSEAELFTLRYAKIAGDNAQAWIIPEATHCNGPSLRPEEYARRMIEFFDDALLH